MTPAASAACRPTFVRSGDPLPLHHTSPPPRAPLRHPAHAPAPARPPSPPPAPVVHAQPSSLPTSSTFQQEVPPQSTSLATPPPSPVSFHPAAPPSTTVMHRTAGTPPPRLILLHTSPSAHIGTTWPSSLVIPIIDHHSDTADRASVDELHAQPPFTTLRSDHHCALRRPESLPRRPSPLVNLSCAPAPTEPPPASSPSVAPENFLPSKSPPRRLMPVRLHFSLTPSSRARRRFPSHAPQNLPPIPWSRRHGRNQPLRFRQPKPLCPSVPRLHRRAQLSDHSAPSRNRRPTTSPVPPRTHSHRRRRHLPPSACAHCLAHMPLCFGVNDCVVLGVEVDDCWSFGVGCCWCVKIWSCGVVVCCLLELGVVDTLGYVVGMWRDNHLDLLWTTLV